MGRVLINNLRVTIRDRVIKNEHWRTMLLFLNYRTSNTEFSIKDDRLLKYQKSMGSHYYTFLIIVEWIRNIFDF